MLAGYCGAWPIKCRQGSKTNKSKCRFWKKLIFDWRVDECCYLDLSTEGREISKLQTRLPMEVTREQEFT
jgi:hypothetical protein